MDSDNDVSQKPVQTHRMTEPGDQAGECPRCDSERVQIGYDTIVMAVYCPSCDVITSIGNIGCKTQTEEFG